MIHDEGLRTALRACAAPTPAPAVLLLAVLLLTVVAGTGILQAQPVTLRSSDGSVTVTGPLFRFDGTIYTIKGGREELNLSVSDFSCISGSCPGPNAGPNTFGIHGSNTVGAELMPRLIEAYAQSRGERVRISNGDVPETAEIKVLGGDGKTRATIDLQARGSGTASPGLASGKAVIGMASRALNAAELAQLAEQGFGDMRRPGNEHVVALDGILVIVSPQNPIGKLSLEQLQGIFSGTVTDWSQAGGTAGRINIYARDAKSGTFDTFRTIVLDPGKHQLAGNAQRFESSNELSDLVANDPNGIGFIGFAYLRNAKAVTLVNDCGMSFAPSTFDVKTEEYPLSRRLFLYSAKVPAQPFAGGLLDFSMSVAAQTIVRDSGFIDQDLEWHSDRQSGRMAGIQPPRTARKGIGGPLALLARDVQETSRISATLRFRPNSIELDNKALEDVNHIARLLEFLRETGSARKLVLAGFSDTVGAVDKNIALSLERANVVRQALSRKAPQYITMIETRGFGPVLPVACNDDEAGRDKNRRVEVWLR